MWGKWGLKCGSLVLLKAFNQLESVKLKALMRTLIEFFCNANSHRSKISVPVIKPSLSDDSTSGCSFCVLTLAIVNHPTDQNRACLSLMDLYDIISYFHIYSLPGE
jgi:hypothetical protein